MPRPSLTKKINLCYVSRTKSRHLLRSAVWSKCLGKFGNIWKNRSGREWGKGKNIAGVTSQFYHRSFIIAIISSQLYHRSYNIACNYFIVIARLYIFIVILGCTVKPVYNDHPRDPKFVAVVDRWSLFRGSFVLQKLKMRPQMVVVVDKWSLFGGGR